MLRTKLYANPAGKFVHQLILQSCCRYAKNTAIVDSSCNRRISYSEYGELLEALARGFVAAGLRPGEVVATYLYNSWEFCATYHAVTLAGGVPTPLNPSYREREVRHQMENSGAVFLVTDGPTIKDINFSGNPHLRRIFTTRQAAAGAQAFTSLFGPATASLSPPAQTPEQTVAALPYSSGTTGLPKGVMLSHYNLVANVYQLLGPHTLEFLPDEVVLCFLPLYHIYGLNVALNPVLISGKTLVLMPRFQMEDLFRLLVEENVSMMPTVPPALNALCQAAERGLFPKSRLRWVKSGAAPLPAELARRFTSLTGILVNQGYGMTEASPVTHLGHLTPPEMNRPASIGQPLAQTECRILDDNGQEAVEAESGELVMRGPQLMLGYWKEPQATAAVLRDGWYWSGDIVTKDVDDFYYVRDRRKEMIKYKGFPVAPAEIEAVLMEHPAVKECGVIGKADAAAGEIPVAFVVLREGFTDSQKMKEELCEFVADKLTGYKQPREVHFIDVVPKTPSGKILRRELRTARRT
jgi:long-chain acyl-CoA synthetase